MYINKVISSGAEGETRPQREADRRETFPLLPVEELRLAPNVIYFLRIT